MAKTFKIDADTIWTETDEIRIHNYPPSPHTFSYVCRVYREDKRNVLGWKLVEGSPVYFYHMNEDQRTLATIAAVAMNRLVETLSHSDELEAVSYESDSGD